MGLIILRSQVRILPLLFLFKNFSFDFSFGVLASFAIFCYLRIRASHLLASPGEAKMRRSFVLALLLLRRTQAMPFLSFVASLFARIASFFLCYLCILLHPKDPFASLHPKDAKGCNDAIRIRASPGEAKIVITIVINI